MNELEKIKENFHNILLDDVDTHLLEMATVVRDDSIVIGVNPDHGRNHYKCEYFKVYNSPSYRKATKEARIMFREVAYVIHRDSKENWKLNSAERKELVDLLNSKRGSVTAWKRGIMAFNYEAYNIDEEESLALTQAFLDTLPEDDIRKKALPIDLVMPDYRGLN